MFGPGGLSKDEPLAEEKAIFDKLAGLSPPEQAAFREENFYQNIKVQSVAELKAWVNHDAFEGASAPDITEDDLVPRFGFSDVANRGVCLWQGSIVALGADAIVNAANTGLWAGGGICGAIHQAAGPLLEQECETIGQPPERCPTGETAITKGYRLPARHVLHTVGPTSEIPDLLHSSYMTTLDVAAQNGLKSVALCCVSTGIFGFRLRLATHIALQAVRQWLDANPGVLDRIVFTMFKDAELDVYEKLMPCYFPRPGDAVPSDASTPPPVPGMPPGGGEQQTSYGDECEAATGPPLGSCAREGCSNPRSGTSLYCSMDCMPD